MKKKPQNYPLFVFTGLVAISALLSLTLPVNPLVLKYYQLSLAGFRLIQLTYVIPLIAIWSAAFYAYYFILRYAMTIRDDKDGKAIFKIAVGIAVLAFGGPATSILSSSLNAIALSHPHFQPSATIISNYVGLTEALVAFGFIGLGARGLADTVRTKISFGTSQLLGLLLIIISSVYCYLIFHPLPGPLKLGLSNRPIYYLPNWLLLATIVIPYVYVWFTGGLATLHMFGYYRKVKGSIYRASITFMTAGMAFIVFAYVVLQYLTTLSSKLAGLKLGPLLLVVYPLLILVSIGYILLAIGAQKLRKIEES